MSCNRLSIASCSSATLSCTGTQETQLNQLKSTHIINSSQLSALSDVNRLDSPLINRSRHDRTSPHLILHSRLTHLTPHFTPPHHTSLHFTSPHLTSPHPTALRLDSSRLDSTHLDSTGLTQPNLNLTSTSHLAKQFISLFRIYS